MVVTTFDINNDDKPRFYYKTRLIKVSPNVIRNVIEFYEDNNTSFYPLCQQEVPYVMSFMT